jgi:hypothetical protein
MTYTQSEQVLPVFIYLKNKKYMEKIPTAEEFFKSKGTLIINNNGTYNNDTPIEYVLELIKIHVEAALKAASAKSKRKEGQITDRKLSDSILNSYSLENIQ